MMNINDVVVFDDDTVGEIVDINFVDGVGNEYIVQMTDGTLTSTSGYNIKDSLPGQVKHNVVSIDDPLVAEELTYGADCWRDHNRPDKIITRTDDPDYFG